MGTWQISFNEFEFLEKDNYSTWKNFMPKLLCCYGQEHWDIVSGKYTRVDAQDKQKFDVIDQIALSTIRLQVDKEIHPWVLGQFTSSKALWDSIELKFQTKEQKKIKKREKQKQRKLKQRESTISEISTFMILVPEIHDLYSASNYLENFLEEFACMADPAQDSGILEKDNDCLTVQLLLDDVDHLAGFHDTSSLGTGMVPVLFEENNMSAELLDLQAQLPDKIQQLEVPVVDDFMAVNSITSITHLLHEGIEYHLDLQFSNLQHQGDSQSILFDLDLQHEVLENTCLLGNSEILDLFYGEEQCTRTTQGVMDAKEEIVSELPWLEIDSKTCDFQSVISQVSTHDLPVYVNVHIPFACTHDGKVEDHNLDVCLGYISCADVEGVIKKLQVLAGQCVEAFYVTNRWLEAYYGSPTMEQLGTAGTSGKAREWYRGRKIWFKIKDKGQSWLLFWLSLLYFTSTA